MRRYVFWGLNCVRNLLFLFALLVVSGEVWAETLAEGVSLVPLTSDGKSVAVAWSNRGDKIAFVREVSKTQRQLLVMNSDGSGEEVVTPVGNPMFVEWSWSGRKLSYEYTNAPDPESQGGVFVYDLDTQETTAISVPYLEGALDPDDGPFWSSDDRYVVYKVRPGVARTREMWVWDAETNKTTRLLTTRGQGKEMRWSPFAPEKISLLIEASAGSFDIATVNPDSSELQLLTDVGAQSIRQDAPRWSPTGEWIAFTSGLEMTQAEREDERADLWVGRPDGSEIRNLTKASSPATEDQLEADELLWSWDGRWILMEADTFDNQGNDIPLLFLVDPVTGHREALFQFSREEGIFNNPEAWKWSYDSTKIAVLFNRTVVKNWGPDARFEQPHWVLGVYDVRTKKFEELLSFDEDIDRKMILAETDRDELEDISWSPDNRSILLTISKIISKAERIFQPDVYRMDLPERLIDASAPQHIGPSIGRGETRVAVMPGADAPSAPSAAPVQSTAQMGEVVDTIVPTYMTVEEAMSSVSPNYAQFITTNTARNTILFRGPAEMLQALRDELALIDTATPHILVDMMAVELTDRANRNLGLDWTYAQGRFGFFQPEGNAIRNLLPDERLDGLLTFPGQGRSIYQGVGKLPSEFFVQMNTLIKDGEGTILANPRTVSMGGREAVIQIRKTVNYFFSEGFDTFGRPIVKKSDISSDTIGRITPTLLPNGNIHLLVDVSVGTFTFSSEAGLPEQITRQASTEVIVHEGETIVIGGLRLQEMVRTITKVPILGYVPLIKPIFTSRKVEIQHSVLTIFITPHVLAPDELRPEWRQMNGEEHVIVPIMEEIPKGKNRRKVIKMDDVSLAPPKAGGHLRRWFRRTF